MIYCPNCGTSNRKGSRFCNECGQPLPSTGTRCPMCDTVNPVGNVYCQSCNARLVPISSTSDQEGSEEKAQPIKGISLPTIPLDETDGERERADPEESGGEQTPPPDWLDELRESAEEPVQDLDAEGREAEGSEEPLASADIPDWLSDLGPIGEERLPAVSSEGPLTEEPTAGPAASGKEAPAEAPGEPEAAEPPPSSPPADTPPPERDATPALEEEPPPEPAEIPDWLRDLGPVTGQTSPFVEDSRPTMEEDLTGEEAPSEERSTEPDISEPSPASPHVEASAPEGEAAPTSDEESPPESAEIPDWLRDLGPVRGQTPPFARDEQLATPEPSAEEFEPSGTGEPAPEEAPQWLREIVPSAGELASPMEGETADAEESEGLETETAAIEIPDWLREAEDGAPPRPPDKAKREEAAPDEESAPGEVRAEATGSLEEVPEPVEIASWLRDAELEKPPPAEPVLPFTDRPEEDVETPDWLIEIMAQTPADEAEASPFPAEPTLVQEEWSAGLERAEIPSWLEELRPTRDESEEAILGPVESEGLLEGLRGLIPSTTAFRPPATLEGSAMPEASEASLARAELLQSLLGQPTVRVRPESGKRTSGQQAAGMVERWLIAGLLVLAVVGMLLAPLVTGQSPQLTAPVTNSGARGLHTIVEELEADERVLIAFDYGPPEADELSVAARPVLEHLLARGVVASIVSTRPDGTLIAESMMRRVADSEDQYTVVGYRPGTATAVSQLLSTVDEPPTMLLILTSRAMPLRVWIEQASARYGEELPLAVVGSAALEPVASPYLDPNAGQVAGAIHGLAGAASYEALRETASDATERLDALAAGHLAIVMLVIVGALIHTISGPEEEKV